jgi:hypothetical protein
VRRAGLGRAQLDVALLLARVLVLEERGAHTRHRGRRGAHAKCAVLDVRALRQRGSAVELQKRPRAAHLGVDLLGARRAGAVVRRCAEREVPAGIEHKARSRALLPERPALAEPILDVPISRDSGEPGDGRGAVGLDRLALCRPVSGVRGGVSRRRVPSGDPVRRHTRTRSCSRRRC